jgi:hypothetical protein
MKKPDLTSLAIPRAKKGEAAPAAPPSTQPVTAPTEEPRTTVSTRLTLSVQERLRRYAFETRRDKQGVVEEALDVFLKSKGH